MGVERSEALLVMSSWAFGLQFGTEQLARLRKIVTLQEPVVLHELDSPEARSRLATADVLLTSWGAPPLTAEILNAAPRLRAVLHCAGSVRAIVTGAVHERGIAVSTAADVNAVPVAEYTLAAIIMAGKKAPFLARRAAWAGGGDDGADLAAADGRRETHGRRDLSNRGRRIGVVGFSRTGRRVMEMLRILETAEILVADPYADADAVAALGGRLTALDEVLRRSEILTLHAPALPETRHLIGAAELAMLPDGATLINTARGALVDHDALAAACATGRIDAILDVTEPEPLPADSPLRRMENVMITPHVAGSLGSETRRMSDHAVDELDRWLRGEPLHGLLDPTAAEVSA
ncbi:hydroxyacid dehydrogenase [Georgenia halophila]|uniref:Hydroxyacid dehydrogenase n=1 Tax=Georgenia halophila TaxID=620889 RepID=A0ABP8KUE4_9MICO